METPKKPLSASSRVKACTECRQHKLRCDASKDHSVPCSRCRRRGLHCEVTTAFRRSKRRTKKDLQAELESLRHQVETGSSGTPVTYIGANDAPMSIGTGTSAPLHHSTSSMASPASLTLTNPGSAGAGGTENVVKRPGLGERIATLSAMPTLPRMIGGLEISAQAIDTCFEYFQRRYLPHIPLLEGNIRPNLAYLQSEFLFWTIVAVGARRYQEDPTVLMSLEPHVMNLAGKAIIARENPIPTIKALLLLCAWPFPHETLNKDPAPVLAGAALQHALSIGLHIYGVGQDFSRTKLAVERAQMEQRRQLWFICIVICQRVSCTTGIPPPLIPDTHGHNPLKDQDPSSTIPRLVAFAKTLSTVQTEGIVQLERNSLTTPPNQRAAVLNPLIETISEQLAAISPESPWDLGTFYVQVAQLQILTFHLFIPRQHLSDDKLYRLYETACLCIETAQRMELNHGLSDCAPIFVPKYLDMAAFTILKISRSHLSTSIDLERGRKAYFFVINFCRNVSVQGGDIMSRSEGILTQLWASKKVFRRKDGSFDSLTLRCGSRLAMSVIYDCLWWWRLEFAGQQDPYDESEKAQGDTLPPEQQQQQHPHPDPSVSPAGTGFDDAAALDFIFPESQWAGSHDLLSLDWSQWQYDAMLPFIDVDTGEFEASALAVQNPLGFQGLLQQT